MHEVANRAHRVIKSTYGLRDAKVESPINTSLQWCPTFSWQASTEIIACEVSERPNFKSLKGFFSDIMINNLYVRIIIATPEPVNCSDYRQDLAELRKMGIGHLCITDRGANAIDFPGILLPLYIVQPNYCSYKRILQPLILKAYNLYMGGNPVNGTQDLGQTVESIIYKLGNQAKNKGKLITGRYTPRSGRHYPVATLIDDLMTDHVIHNGVLGRCRGFIDDRHKCSHRPRNMREAKRLVTILKNCWEDGLRALSELPTALSARHYRLQI